MVRWVNHVLSFAMFLAFLAFQTHRPSSIDQARSQQPPENRKPALKCDGFVTASSSSPNSMSSGVVIRSAKKTGEFSM
jgi:hypothetical protein